MIRLWLAAWAVILPAAAGSGAPLPALRVGMDPRSLPSIYVPGLDYSREDSRKDPQLTPAQIQRLEGFEVEVLHALADKLAVNPVVVPTSWFALEPGLVAKRFDLILSSWTPGDGTPPGVVASDPYWEWGLVVAVRAKDERIRTLADLAGRRLGQFDDPSVTRPVRVMATSLGAQLVPGDDGSLLFRWLEAGTVDAVLFDSPYVRWRVSRSQAFRIVGEPLNRLGYHVGVRREDGALLARVNGALKALRDSGELSRIRRKWEGGS